MNSDRNAFKQIVEQKLAVLWPEWQIVEELGNGAFGSVYKIARELNGRSFYSALKVIRIERGSDETAVLLQQGGAYSRTGSRADEEYRNKVTKALDEINIMEELKGAPNVVRIEDFQIVWEGDTALVFIRMELLQSLLNWICENGIPDEETVRKIGTDICNALQFCAEKNIIHRDIKPANIFLDPYGEFKLGDFGISRQLDLVCGNSSLTAVGTVSYMAPEVYRMEPYDNTADIYSLGLVLYELSNHGRMPFLPPYPETVSLMEQADAQARRMRGEPFPLPDNVSKGLGKVLCKACEKSPTERYQSAAAFKKSLEQCDTADESKRTDPSLYRTETLVVKNNRNDNDRNESNRNESNRGKYIIAIVAAAVCVIAGIFLYKNLKPSGGESSEPIVQAQEVTAEKPAESDAAEIDVQQPTGEDTEPDATGQEVTEPEGSGNEEPSGETPAQEEPAEDGPAEEPAEEGGKLPEDIVLPTAIPDEYYYNDGHTYAIYDAHRYGFDTYDAVSAFCHEQGGHLAVINDRGENTFLYNLMKENSKITIFFGYTDKDQEGVWVWDGDESDYENWTRTGDWDLPDNGESWGGGEWKNGGEDYAEFNYDREKNWGAPNDTTWNDAAFMENTTLFFCEWEYDMRVAEEALK